MSRRDEREGKKGREGGRDPLPERTTRGRRQAAAEDDEEEGQADAEFWNQEFFKEEVVDDDYQTEDEPEDQIDTDFDDEEEADDDENVEVKDEPRKKAIKPPGRQAKPPAAKPKPKPKQKKPKDEDEDEEPPEDEEDEEEHEMEEEEDGGDDDGEEEERPKKRSKPKPEPKVYAAPTLRRSTVAKVADAELQRKWKKEEKPTRKRAAGGANSNWKPLTQQEMLAEAALNEIENTRSLKAMLAREEETKRKAQVVKKKNTGPVVKFRTKQGPAGEEVTTLELINTHQPPPWMARRCAPVPPDKPHCAMTGLPARYRDATTHLPLANTLAFSRLRSGAGPLAPNLQQQLVMHHHMELQEQQEQQLKAKGRGWRGADLQPQLAAQKRRREELVERARALAKGPAAPDPPLQLPTLDMMALLVDVRRSLTA
ncbi:Vacuolar protein sorting-associated protein 72 [Tetrabaena socialis]|uniref:Vacuolar protein sorting-associated protein 72 n=1 Tax=Tetrabaena socialis TaxID=47790 RepID=A0A2J8A360_9CHLO|nr:Vacuolar protein sorting-associated protein 72 [Tetrabaena socialis]|eukprot:PNH06943.1 Vacuolar protein sorting-associated protein 72 [Tetrabaena socialis]